MGKHLKCVIKESKTNAGELWGVLKFIPKLLAGFSVLFAPIVIGLIILILTKPTEMNAGFMFAAILVTTIPWVIFIGSPLYDRLWVTPEKDLRDMLRSQLGIGSKLIYDMCVQLPRYIAAFMMIGLPAAIYIGWLLFNGINDPSSANVEGWHILVLLGATLVWGVLIGFPVVECYIFPSSKEPVV